MAVKAYAQKNVKLGAKFVKQLFKREKTSAKIGKNCLKYDFLIIVIFAIAKF